MVIGYHKNFKKNYSKLPMKLRERFGERLNLFVENPFAPELNNHALSGKYMGYRSINVTGDWRAIYEIQNNTIQFLLIGTHSDLYK